MTDVQYGKIERPGEKVGMATQQGEHVILIYIKFGTAPQLITIDMFFSRQYTSHCYAQGRSQFAPTSVLCSPPLHAALLEHNWARSLISGAGEMTQR